MKKVTIGGVRGVFVLELVGEFLVIVFVGIAIEPLVFCLVVFLVFCPSFCPRICPKW